MRYLLVVLLLAGCSNKYDECIEQQKAEYRSSHPGASYGLIQSRQKDFELSCSKFKKGIQLEYHAHIYWRDTKERARAISFRQALADLDCELGRVWDMPIGPHPLPMYQIIYTSSNKELVEQYLAVNRSTNTVLLHESINDDLRDHTDGARWLGETLELKLDIFKEQ